MGLLDRYLRPDARTPLPPAFLTAEDTGREDITVPARDAANRGGPVPLNSITAAATRITSRNIKSDRRGRSNAQPWQEDAWDMYDQVGEQRFLATTLAGRMAQARLYIGRRAERPTDPPIPLDPESPDFTENDRTAYDVFTSFGETESNRAQMIARLYINLFVPGDGWFVGIPARLFRDDPQDGDAAPTERLAPQGRGEDTEGGDIDLDDLRWKMLSITEVTFKEGLVTLQLGTAATDKIECSPNDIFLIRIWRPHPRKWWEADSPTRSSLPVLRELVGLTQKIAGQIDSRLAGAGVFLVPNSAKEAVLAQMQGQDLPDDYDPFTEAMMEAMLTAIQDRSNASAVVPLVFTVPDESVEKFKHLTFSTPLDAADKEMREEAIRRLALGEDAPPELLLGVAGMNHWGAWLVREDVVTTHLEPPLALTCDAITTQYQWPVLMQQGMSEEDATEYVIWYDVSHLIQRPNRLEDASTLHTAGVISDTALRDAGGFTEEDAPPLDEDTTDPVVETVLTMLRAAPTLAQTPGLAVLAEQIRALVNGTEIPSSPTASPQAAGEEEAAPVDSEEGPPDTDTDTPENEAPSLAAALASAMNGRALPARTPR